MPCALRPTARPLTARCSISSARTSRTSSPPPRRSTCRRPSSPRCASASRHEPAAGGDRLRRGAAPHGAAFPRLAGRGARDRFRARRQPVRAGVPPPRQQRAAERRGEVELPHALLRHRDAPPDRDRRRRRGDGRARPRSRRGRAHEPRRPLPGEPRQQAARSRHRGARVHQPGPKGEALRRIVEEYAPSRAIFIDDIANHHASAAGILPDISRLHFCGEPTVAPHIPCALQAGHAHARLDTWAEALPWVLETLHGTRP